MAEVGCWAAELDSVFGRVAGRFDRADPRRRMRDHVRGLLGQAARKNGWQVHARLAVFRVRKNRELFLLEYREAAAIIDDHVKNL